MLLLSANLSVTIDRPGQTDNLYFSTIEIKAQYSL